jgi:hypothetical protein
MRVIFCVPNLLKRKVYDGVMQTVKKAPGQDGFPTEFYKRFWGVIKKGVDGNVYNFSQGRATVV